MGEETVFVARERELARLDEFLQRAIDGQGQLCFVTGEAGSGKTALVLEHARRSQKRNSQLVVGYGQCNAHTGIGDPFLPFREILRQLTGDSDEDLGVSEENTGRLRQMVALSGRALVEVGPDLVGLFLPAAGLLAKLAAFAFDEGELVDKLRRLTLRRRERPMPGIHEIDQSQIFEQYTNVLKQLASKAPLLLIVDDLHWTDAGTAELLFHLSRRIRTSRILIVGTFREEEVALERNGQRHPIEKVVTECKRDLGDIDVELGKADQAERQEFVDRFLNTEPNRFGRGFREALFRHTGGHALFTIELLRAMQERGDLLLDSHGCWVEGPQIAWDALPARIEGVIQERIGRLRDELRELLTVASVEGETFTAEVVARVQDQQIRHIVRQLADQLARQHRLVDARGVRPVNGSYLSIFQFSHNLFQAYLYNDLTEAERHYLHHDVAVALEVLFGSQLGEIAARLAQHFLEAGAPARARHYLRLAGQRAAAQFANTDAVTLFTRALELTPADALEERCTLLFDRELVNDLKGERSAQRMDLAALDEIVEGLLDKSMIIRLALRKANYACVTSDFPQACVQAQEAVRLAREVNDLESEATGELRWGSALISQGHYESAREHLAQAVDCAEAAELPLLQAESLHRMGVAFIDQADHRAAREHFERALDICQEAGDRRGEAAALNGIANVNLHLGSLPLANEQHLKALEIRREIGDRLGEAKSLTNLGVVAGNSGDATAEIDYQAQALEIYRLIEDELGQTAALNNLGAAYYYKGDFQLARDYFEQTLQIRRRVGDRPGVGEALNNLCAVCQAQGDYGAAEQYALEALGISQEVGDPLVEAVILLNLGTCRLAGGDTMAAQRRYEESLQIYRRIEEPKGQVSTLRRLGGIHDCLGDLGEAERTLRQALDLSRQIGGTYEEAILSDQSLVSYHLGEYERALELADAALAISRQKGYRAGESDAWMRRGDALAELGRLDESIAAYQESVRLRRDFERARMLEPLAGLAEAYLAQDMVPQAEECVDEIMAVIDAQGPEYAHEPLRVMLTCHRVHRLAGDPTALDILIKAHDMLCRRAEKLDDIAMRRSFLENVAVNREIVRSWRELQA